MRESRTLGSVRAKAEWLSYSTIPARGRRRALLITPHGDRKQCSLTIRRGPTVQISLPLMGIGNSAARAHRRARRGYSLPLMGIGNEVPPLDSGLRARLLITPHGDRKPHRLGCQAGFFNYYYRAA